jgi:hypothetical protein
VYARATTSFGKTKYKIYLKTLSKDAIPTVDRATIFENGSGNPQTHKAKGLVTQNES